MKDFVKARVNPEFQSGYYAGLIDKYNDSLDQKSIRNSRIYFRSSSKSGSVEGLNISFLSIDEYDHIAPTAEISAMESMSSSKYGLVRRWSTPTADGYGISKLYDQSDQRKWVYRCPHCGLVQQLDYQKNIKLVNPDGIDIIGKKIKEGTYIYVCQKCGKELDRWYNGFWDITAPGDGGRIHGYSISQLDAVWISASAIKEKELSSPNKQFFMNYTLGRSYEDTSNSFYEEDVLSHRDDRPRVNTRGDYRLVSAGIDWGQNYHHLVVLGMTTGGRVDVLDLKRFNRSQGVEHIEEDLRNIILELEKYRPNIIVPDLGFSGNYVTLLQQHFGKQVVYGCVVKSAKSNGDPVAHFNETSSQVTIDKLTQNVMMMSDMKRGDIHFYKNVDQDLKLFINHWMNVVIRTDEDETTHQPIKTIMRKGDDHFAQSSVYAKVGMNKLIDVLREERETPSIVTALDSDVGAVLNQEPTDLASEFDIM